MNPVAIEHAKERLEVAFEAVDRLAAATEAKSFKCIRREWTNFLLAASAIYSKLEQGAKSNGKSTAWFGRKKKERKDDPLLCYIHHARNTDHHGLSPTMKEGAMVTVTMPTLMTPSGPVQMIGVAADPDAPPTNFKCTNTVTGKEVPVIREVEKYLAAITVVDDKHGDRFDPPKSHLGEAIEVDEPAGIARLAVEYLKDLVAEAGRYVAP